MSYAYDKHGRLILDENWSEKNPEEKLCTNYKYNEKGLLIEKENTVEVAGKIEKRDSEVWVYGYY
jgi:hypothetical protein